MKAVWLAAALVLPAVASAQEGSLQLGIAGGRLWTDALVPLGDAWEVTPRAGYFLTDQIAVELEAPFGFGKTTTVDPYSYVSLTPRLDIYGVILPDQRIEPYLVAGPGMFWTKAPAGPKRIGFNYPNPNVDFLYNIGAGVLLPAGPVHVRTDIRVVGNIGSQYETGPEATGFHVEWSLGVGLRVGGAKDTDHDRVTDDVDQCPTEKEDKDGFQDTDGCPDLDNDNDGVPDTTDTCPIEAEDEDGFADDDGCPDLDNDADTLLDTLDECPDEPGPSATKGCPDTDADGLADADDECPEDAGPAKADGCPDADSDRVPDYRDECPDKALPEGADPRRSNGCPSRVFATDKGIVITEKVHFATGKADILEDSFGLLDDVAKVLTDFPGLKKVEVAGHTDTDGDDAANLTLSQQRAEAVMAYLVGKGIAADRLVAKGYGETRPIGDNATDEGKAMNRRVEFTILEQEAPKAHRKGKRKPE